MRPRFFIGPAGPGTGSTAPGHRDAPPAHPADPVGIEVALQPGDARHARTVLRVRVGEPCEVVLLPGGRVFEGVFADVGGSVVVRLQRELPEPAVERSVIALVQGLPVPRKVDDIVEKGTEVGVSRFVLVPAHGSPRLGPEKLAGRVERWARIAGEAAKQSRQTTVPVVEAADSLEAAAALVGAAGYCSVVLTPGAHGHLGDLIAGWAPDDAGQVRVALWIGPEGGWADDELERVTALGLPVAGLGRRVLRTETAGPVAAAIARFALGDR